MKKFFNRANENILKLIRKKNSSLYLYKRATGITKSQRFHEKKKKITHKLQFL